MVQASTFSDAPLVRTHSPCCVLFFQYIFTLKLIVSCCQSAPTGPVDREAQKANKTLHSPLQMSALVGWLSRHMSEFPFCLALITPGLCFSTVGLEDAPVSSCSCGQALRKSTSLLPQMSQEMRASGIILDQGH